MLLTPPGPPVRHLFYPCHLCHPFHLCHLCCTSTALRQCLRCSSYSIRLLSPSPSQLGPAKTLKIPVIPLGVLARTSIPLIFHPPFTLRWVLASVTANDSCMDEELLQRLFQRNFGA